jgi:cytochrome c oxidase subunit IV
MVYRKDEAHPKKYSWKMKLIVIFAFVAAFAFLLSTIVYLIRIRGSPLMIIGLAILVLILIPVAIFSIDAIFYHLSWMGFYDSGDRACM